MDKKYKLKVPIRGNNTDLKGYEVKKIMDNIEKYEEQRQFWKILPFALLVAFVVFTIIILASGG